MIILNVQGLSKSFGDNKVLNNISFSLKQGQKIGLVGTNGSGKSTLLKIIAGEIEQDAGMISKKKDLQIGYLAQHYTPQAGKTVYEELESVFEDVFLLETKLRSIEHALSKESDEQKIRALGDEYAKTMFMFEAKDGYAAQSLTQGVFAGLGFLEGQKNQLASSLSGGEITRLCLGRLLLSKPDVLLLDEPTNHLDLQALSWLEEFLGNYAGAAIIVSHDRYFIDKLASDMIELVMGEAECYTGNYSSYQMQRAERYLSRKRAFDRQQKEIKRQEAIIARFQSFNREKSIKAAESRQKKLDKMERLERPPEEEHIRFSFTALRRMGEMALTVKELEKRFDGRELFKNVSFDIRAGDRVALIGPNGVGKSTLLKCLVGQNEKTSGRFSFGTNVDIGYYSQKQDTLDANKSILDEVWGRFPRKTQTQIRSALGLFLFSGEDVYEKIGVLSGGEKARVSLAELMLQQNNFLILDEPTNHLDADSREVLEDALASFDGVIFAVSHDRYFINRFANKVMLLEGDGVQIFEGNYDDFMLKRELLKDLSDVKVLSNISKTELQKIKKKSREEKEKIKNVKNNVKLAEEKVAQIEKKVQEIEAQLADPAVYANDEKAKEVNKLYQEALEELDDAYSAWEEAQEALENA